MAVAKSAGYSGTPLAKKLGIKEGATVTVVNAPTDYRDLLQPLPPGVTFAARADKHTALAHLFTAQRSELERTLAQWRKALAVDATVWVSWPKKSAKVATDITEDTVREVALPLGFVDVKVCAIDAVWSGLKLVVRKDLR
jgi:hypothetical protein